MERLFAEQPPFAEAEGRESMEPLQAEILHVSFLEDLGRKTGEHTGEQDEPSSAEIASEAEAAEVAG